MSAGGTRSTHNQAGKVEPNGGVRNAARLIESRETWRNGDRFMVTRTEIMDAKDAAHLVASRNQTVTAALVRYAFPSLTEEVAQQYAVMIEHRRDLHGDNAATLYVHELARRLNR